jgi:hypothetical protein
MSFLVSCSKLHGEIWNAYPDEDLFVVSVYERLPP